MCGIAGIIGEGEAGARRDCMLDMLGMIRHRGPDQFGVYQDAAATLGSARLSIIDLNTGQQPISNEDGSLWIVFNGEIFNYIELRPELQARGHRFRTATDTEVLLHLYEEYGAGCLERLNGQFAFAIWDARDRRLLLARDRLGIRPLYYTHADGLLLFASEVKALFAHPAVRRELDPVAVRQVFTYWSTLAGRSAFRGVRELPPGHTLSCHDGSIEMRRYWRLDFSAEPERDGSEREYLERFRELLVDATLIRLRSDVPVGAYLSGGLDSSMIARIIRSRTSNELATFSIAFDDPEFDESGFQLRMAKILGTRHEVVRATHADIGRVFPEVVWHTETPLTRTAPAPMFLLSNLVRDSGFKVVMTGEGADEFLAGYDIFKEAAIRRFCLRHRHSALRPLLFRRLYADIPGLRDTSASFLAAFFLAGSDPDSPYFSHAVRWRNNSRALRFLSREAAEAARQEVEMPDLPPAFHGWGPLERAQFLEATVFLSEYLLSSQGDRVSMAHSVESRLPYLDYRVVEFANRLPPRLKLHGLKDKRLLRLLGREFLPADVWRRPKRPYRAPIHKSFFPASPDYVCELLSPERIRAAGLFYPPAVSQLVGRIAGGAQVGETDDMALAGILSTQLAHHAFVEHFPPPRPVVPGRDDVAFRRKE
jgi:asparagine synthase (glutamine-hydrolysing)